ncbi:MAG TPA: Ig-like domain-containing protein [Kofleriaceae bacterium]|nr:Ig-like domain-containing protein [Kofleriaceae bacterium]
MTHRVVVAVALVLAGCYDVPKPDCGFRCGPDRECPEEYVCGSDNRCRREGTDVTLTCATPDAFSLYSPRVSDYRPRDGVTVPTLTEIVVTFDVDVDNVSPETFLVADATGPVGGTVTYDRDTYKARFTRDVGLPALQLITVTLTDAIVDQRRDKHLMPKTWSFMTGPDLEGPRIAALTPVAGQVGVAVDTNVAISASEPITTVTDPMFRIVGVPATVSSSGTTATLDPTQQLAPNQLHTVNVSGIRDLAGNDMVPVMFSYSFTTGADTVPPNVVTTAPPATSNDIAVGSDIVITFDEPVMNVTSATFQVNGGAIAGAVTLSNGNRTATFDPTANLPAASTITVTLGSAITDVYGNAYAGTSYSFTTM